MPLKPRIEYAGAIYHVVSRGNRRQDIFVGDVDRHAFRKTLAEACQKTGWQVHAYGWMSNHYHLVLETPHANLVAGMAWSEGYLGQPTLEKHRSTPSPSWPAVEAFSA
jgi:REP element-mobilizing transposase RayT